MLTSKRRRFQLFIFKKRFVASFYRQINNIDSSLLAGGYWGFHRGKPFPFANRAPSWIFEARAPGYERVSAKMEGGGGGGKRKTAVFHPSPRPPPLAHFVDSLPGPDLAARIQDGDLITNSGFFD